VYESGDRRHVQGDWASGFTKYDCPLDSYAAGFTKHWWGTSGVMCLRANRPLGSNCRTAWFDRGDNRASSRGGDFAAYSYKGQCGDREYVAGIAQRDGNASALLCCEADTYFALRNARSGMCLDISGGRMDNDTPVITWDCHGGANQKWSYDGATGLIRSQQNSDFCLDDRNQHQDGGRLAIWRCNGGEAQRFELTSTGVIRQRSHPSLVVDSASTGRGDVVSWTFHDGSNQHWDAIR
jgi:hypothetical protein